jgi:putative hydrolase of the HAD superfamily
MTQMPGEVLSDVPIGARVVVRHLIEDGDRATDVVGELAARTATSLTVRTRRGPVTVELTDVVVAKVVPDAPTRGWRTEAFLRRAGVAVLDLDGVLRTFDTSGELALAGERLGLPPRELLELAFALPEARAMVTGRARYAEWVDALRARLLADRHAEDAVEHLVATWQADHGTPMDATVALVDELVEAGTPVFVFTNGTDRVPEELTRSGLERLVPLLLNAHDLGWAKPDPQAYAAAHADIERRLRRVVGRAEVHFTDDLPGNVDAARAFGWQARVFIPPPR